MTEVKYSSKDTSYCPRLIEVALPIREIPAESARDKNFSGR